MVDNYRLNINLVVVVVVLEVAQVRVIVNLTIIPMNITVIITANDGRCKNTVNIYITGSCCIIRQADAYHNW